MKNIAVIAAAAYLATGCVTVPVKKPPPPVALRTAVQPVDGNEQAMKFADTELRAAMKDPDSMKLELLDDAYGARNCSTLGNSQEYKVWASAVRVNAKNSYGGYTGFKTYLIYFADGEPVAFAKVAGELQKYGTYLCPQALLIKIR